MSENTRDKVCRNCDHWESNDENRDMPVCKRYPKEEMKFGDDYCGEHKPKEPKT